MRDVSTCPWPHEVDSPICVYDRESYEKYKTGEYKLPKRCICGAELTYVGHVAIALVEQGQLNGEMILQVEVPLRHVTLNLSDDVRVEDELKTYEIPERVQKKLNAQADLIEQQSMGCSVAQSHWCICIHPDLDDQEICRRCNKPSPGKVGA